MRSFTIYNIINLFTLIFVSLGSYHTGNTNIESKTMNTSRYKRGIMKSMKNKFTNLVTSKGKNNKTSHDKKITKVIPNINIFDKKEPKLNKSVIIENGLNKNYRCSDTIVAKFMTTPQLIASQRYMSESHTIVTDDGYILTVHRIPSSSPDKPIPQKTVLLQHGLLGSSASWVIPGRNKGLAYILSDAGYDVWLANSRGNTYTKAHVTKRVDSPEFWNFTFHEVGQHDLPAVIDYIILRKGGDVKINVVGYSLGTTVLFALLSTKPRYNEILRAGFALGPVAYMSNIKTPFKVMSKFSDIINFVLKITDGTDEYLPRKGLLKYLSRHSCTVYSLKKAICKLSKYTLCGHGKKFDSTLVPIIMGHMPGGTSKKTLLHYAQEIRAGGKFQMFDYGAKGNKLMYGVSNPPEYPVNKITLPIAVFSAPDDWLSDFADATRLYKNLANPIEHYVVPSADFNHIDFVYANDTAELVYKKLLELMDRPLPHEQLVKT